jgi:Tfp pilus assembly protein PilN
MTETENISFLPDDYLDRKAQRRTNVICAVLTGIVMTAIISAFSLTDRVGREAEARHSKVEREYAEASKQIQQFQELEQKERTMARQAELASSLLEKIPRSNVLADITNGVPAGVSLTDFTLDSKRHVSKAAAAAAPAPTNNLDSKAPPQPAAAAVSNEPIAYDVSLTVSGTASNDVQVAELMHKLSQSPLFKDVNLVISDELAQTARDTDPKLKMRHFQIEMSLVSDSDITNNNNFDRPTLKRNSTAELPTN